MSAPDLPCGRCGASTPWETLSHHGGWCYGCYAAYCRAVPRTPVAPTVPAEAVPPDAPQGLAWAWRLRWLHSHGAAHGYRLTAAQVSDYRDVMERRVHPINAADADARYEQQRAVDEYANDRGMEAAA